MSINRRQVMAAGPAGAAAAGIATPATADAPAPAGQSKTANSVQAGLLSLARQNTHLMAFEGGG